MPKKRRILHTVRIEELSAVDRPAQEGAKMTLIKRAEGLTAPGTDGGQSDETETNKGDAMTDAEKLAKAEQDAAEAKAAADAALAAEVAKVATLTKIAALNDADKAHYEAVKSLDEEGAAAFLDMDADARKGEVEKAASSDPVIYKSDAGYEYKRSEKRAADEAKRADESARELHVLKAAAADADLSKRAETEIKHLKGEPVAKVALLKAVDGIKDETVRTAVLEILKASDGGLAEAMKTLGTVTGKTIDQSGPAAKLDEMARAHALSASVTYAKAYDTVIQSPEGKDLYKELTATPAKVSE